MARIGLWGSVGVTIVAALFVYASPWRFQQSDYMRQWMTIAGSVLAVLAMSMALLVIRRRVPQLRQSESLQAKLEGYAAHVQSLYLSLLAVVTLLCLLMVLSGQNVLLMLAMVTVLMLLLAFPNIYKVKADLGLTDDEMKSLYGDKYIAGNGNE